MPEETNGHPADGLRGRLPSVVDSVMGMLEDTGKVDHVCTLSLPRREEVVPSAQLNVARALSRIDSPLFFICVSRKKHQDREELTIQALSKRAEVTLFCSMFLRRRDESESVSSPKACVIC